MKTVEEHSCCFCSPPARWLVGWGDWSTDDLLPGACCPPKRIPGPVSISISTSSACCHFPRVIRSMDIQWNVLLLTKTQTLAILSHCSFSHPHKFSAQFSNTPRKALYRNYPEPRYILRLSFKNIIQIPNFSNPIFNYNRIVSLISY